MSATNSSSSFFPDQDTEPYITNLRAISTPRHHGGFVQPVSFEPEHSDWHVLAHARHPSSMIEEILSDDLHYLASRVTYLVRALGRCLGATNIPTPQDYEDYEDYGELRGYRAVSGKVLTMFHSASSFNRLHEVASDLEAPTLQSRCNKRLTELGELQDGWLDGQGRRPTTTALKRAREFSEYYIVLDAEFAISPTETGGIVFEFERNSWDMSVEFTPKGKPLVYGVKIGSSEEYGPRGFPSMNHKFKSLMERFTQ